jgi:hypothetical protein
LSAKTVVSSQLSCRASEYSNWKKFLEVPAKSPGELINTPWGYHKSNVQLQSISSKPRLIKNADRRRCSSPSLDSSSRPYPARRPGFLRGRYTCTRLSVQLVSTG